MSLPHLLHLFAGLINDITHCIEITSQSIRPCRYGKWKLKLLSSSGNAVECWQSLCICDDDAGAPYNGEWRLGGTGKKTAWASSPGPTAPPTTASGGAGASMAWACSGRLRLTRPPPANPPPSPTAAAAARGSEADLAAADDSQVTDRSALAAKNRLQPPRL